jgi:hypothetical protein
MALSVEDTLAIHQLINLLGHITDDHELDRAGEIFTADVVYDLGDLGYGTLHGLDELRSKALEIGVQNPIGHHVTNIVLTEEADGRVRARSKALGIQRNGTTGSVVYEDLIRLTPDGWRIVHRLIRRTESGRRYEG